MVQPIGGALAEAYEPRSGCPINATVEVFGDRWSLLVLRDIVFGDRRYYREMRAGSEEGIARNATSPGPEPRQAACTSGEPWNAFYLKVTSIQPSFELWACPSSFQPAGVWSPSQ